MRLSRLYGIVYVFSKPVNPSFVITLSRQPALFSSMDNLEFGETTTNSSLKGLHYKELIVINDDNLSLLKF